MTLVSGTRACCFRNSRPRALRRRWRSTISVAHRRLACQHRLVADGYTPFVLIRCAVSGFVTTCQWTSNYGS